jgi:hypothetical protein
MAVHAEARGPILEITLDRPKANAIDRETSLALHGAFARLRDDPELRVGIFTGELRVGIFTGAGERFFSAGWDLKAAAAGEEDPSTDFGPGGFAGFTEMFDLDKPVIAAVNGMAVGGGFEMVLACDLIVAAEHAQFFLPELSLGIVPDAGGVQRLPALLPRAVATDLILTLAAARGRPRRRPSQARDTRALSRHDHVRGRPSRRVVRDRRHQGRLRLHGRGRRLGRAAHAGHGLQPAPTTSSVSSTAWAAPGAT